jgi:hypothetical protein
MTAMRNILMGLAMLSAVAAPAAAQTMDPHQSANAPTKMPPAATSPGMMTGAGEGGMMKGDRMPMGMMMGMMRSRMMEMMWAHTDGALAFLKTELKITDNQTPQWNAFADAVRANAKSMKDMHASMMEQRDRSAALPDRLGFHEKMLAAHLDAVRQIKAAVEPLYTSFSDEQKRTADEVLSPMGMMMGMM